MQSNYRIDSYETPYDLVYTIYNSDRDNLDKSTVSFRNSEFVVGSKILQKVPVPYNPDESSCEWYPKKIEVRCRKLPNAGDTRSREQNPLKC